MNLLISALSSSLDSKLSHQTGLTYSAGAYLWGFSDTGFICMGLGTDPGNLHSARSLLLQTLSDFPKSNFERQIQDHYVSNRNGMYLAIRTNGYGPTLEGLAANPKLPYRSPSEYLRQVQELSPDYLQQVAARFFDPGQLRFAYLGAKGALQQAGLSDRIAGVDKFESNP